jgi:hypothetical protein
MPFAYTSGNPDNLTAGGPARMQDIQGPFYDLRAYLNSAAGSGGGSGGVASALAAAPVLDVGMVGQVRAGHQLANADFTALGLSVPTALWNLGDLTDISGNGRALINKGGVGFVSGINGLATTAAQFTGSTGQALYVADTGAADPLRIKTGSWGCWFRTAKRGRVSTCLTKFNSGAYSRSTSNCDQHQQRVVVAYLHRSGTDLRSASGVSDVADDRWHFVVATFDGTTVRVYVDGVLEGSGHGAAGRLNGSAGPLNIGAYGADAGLQRRPPHFGRVDEAFVTADVLSDDQVRCLYAAKVAHGLGLTPRDVTINVNRRRKGATLTVADFTTQPLRLHNFTAGVLTDEGSNGAGARQQRHGGRGAPAPTGARQPVSASRRAVALGDRRGTPGRDGITVLRVLVQDVRRGHMGVMGWGNDQYR